MGSHRLRWLLSALLAGWLALSLTCSPDETVAPGDPGAFHLVLRFPSQAADSSRATARAEPGSPDSVRLVIEDDAGRVAARAASGVDAEGRFRLEVDLRAGGPYSAVATVESEGRDPRDPQEPFRGGLFLGALDGIRIEPGEVTKDTITVRSLLTSPSLGGGRAGDLDYVIFWDRVEDAEGYDLVARAEPSGSAFTWETPETSRVFALAEVKRRLRSEGTSGADSVFFWVRSRTPWILGQFDDSLVVPVGEWKDLPRVIDVDPLDGASGVPDTAAIVLRFSQPMDTLGLRGPALEVLRRDGAPLEEMRRDIGRDRMSVRFVPQGFLPNEKELEVRVSSDLRDFEGKPLDQDPKAEGLQSFTSGFTVEPYLWLRVTAADPPDGAQGLPRRPIVDLELTRPVDEATLSGSVTVSDSLGRSASVSTSFDQGDTSLTVTVLEDLPWGVGYTLRVAPALRDLRGRPLDQDPGTAEPDTFVTRFRVAPQPESPRVAAVDPSPGASNVLITTDAAVTFNRKVRPQTVTSTSFAIRKPPTFANIPGAIEHAGDSLTFTFRPSAPLDRGLGYRIAVTTSVTDPEGNPLDQDRSVEGYQDFQSEFRTEDNPSVLRVSPESDENVPVRPSFTLRFSKALDPSTVDESSVYIERVESGNRVTSVVDLLPGNEDVVLAPVDSLGFVTTYRLWATTDIRSGEGSFLDQNRATPEHDPFSFSFTTVVDSTPPRVVSVTPPDGSSDVPDTTRAVAVTFENPVKPSTVYEETFVLARILSSSDSVLVSGDVVVQADSVRAEFRPAAPLEFESLYRVWVKRFVSSPFGILLDQDPETPGEQEFMSEFTTETETISPRVAAVVPEDGAESVPRETMIFVTFDEPMRPETVPDAITLSRAGSPVPGIAEPVAPDDSTQWRFDPDAILDLLTTYTVRVDTTALDRVGNPFDQDPETDGLQPFTSIFTTVTDTAGPTVTVVDPPDSSMDISATAPVTLTFSEPIDPLTVGTGTFLVAPVGGPAVEGTIAILQEDQVRWTPAAPLEFDTWHEVTATSGIKDLYGNGLDQDPSTEPLDPFVSRFRTEPENISPRVVELILPEIPVPVDAILAVVFSEPVDPQTIAPGGVDILLGEVPADLVRWVSESGDTAYVQPAPDLQPDKVYALRVTPSVTDTLGNPLDQDPDAPGLQDFEESFQSGQDNKPPRVTAVTPADNATGLGASPEIRLTFNEALSPTTVDVTTVLFAPDSGSVQYAVGLMTDGRTVAIVPSEPLQEESTYTIEALHNITDLAGNGLDQDPETPEPETFSSRFTTGQGPELSLPEGACEVGDSAAVSMDASGSSDPDGEIASVVWDWGDGSIDTLSAPDGLEALHIYSCTDAAGCDSLDNDGDGLTDESGAVGCDESYRIVITLVDDDGFAARDTTGASFCDFRVILSDPPDGSDDISTMTSIKLQFSRSVSPGSLTGESVVLRVQGGPTVTTLRTLTDGGRRLILDPLEELEISTDYEVVVNTDVVSEDGETLDQEPCEPNPVGWVSTFRTAPE